MDKDDVRDCFGHLIYELEDYAEELSNDTLMEIVGLSTKISDLAVAELTAREWGRSDNG